MWFCGLHNSDMTSCGHILAVVSALLLRCSFAATSKVIMTAKLLKPMLGDCSINRRLTDTMLLTSENYISLSVVIC